ncbi:MAG TPA: hypothetical protein VHB73_01155 [Alphaproteobacteria bacterium]|nr:hypothetical protein [Alphaproteobacteria bacterium]
MIFLYAILGILSAAIIIPAALITLAVFIVACLCVLAATLLSQLFCDLCRGIADFLNKIAGRIL